MNDYKAIDIHCHYNNGSIYDTKVSPLYSASLDFLRAERLRMDIDKIAFAGSFAACISDKEIAQQNEDVFALAQQHDWFYQWVVVDARKKETLIQAEKMLKSKKTIGIKIHSVCHGYDFAPYADEVFELASRFEKAVMMHPDDKPEAIAKIADKWQKTKLILAHLGAIEHIDAISGARNVYADTSGNASSQNNVIEYAVNKVGSEKILFGTDTYSCAFQKGRILLADISEEDKQNILYKNAERIFSLE